MTLNAKYIDKAIIFVHTERGEFEFEVLPDFGFFFLSLGATYFKIDPGNCLVVPDYLFISLEDYKLISHFYLKTYNSEYFIDSRELVIWVEASWNVDEQNDNELFGVLEKLIDRNCTTNKTIVSHSSK